MPEKFILLEVITLTEARDWWGVKSPKTIQTRLWSLAARTKSENVIRRSGNAYLVTVWAMLQEFGRPKNERPNYE